MGIVAKKPPLIKNISPPSGSDPALWSLREAGGLFRAPSSLSFSPWTKVQLRFAHRQPAVPSTRPGAKADSSPGPAPCTCPQPFSRTESRRETGEEEKEGEIGVEPSKGKSKVEAQDISARRTEGLL